MGSNQKSLLSIETGLKSHDFSNNNNNNNNNSKGEYLPEKKKSSCRSFFFVFFFNFSNSAEDAMNRETKDYLIFFFPFL